MQINGKKNTIKTGTKLIAARSKNKIKLLIIQLKTVHLPKIKFPLMRVLARKIQALKSPKFLSSLMIKLVMKLLLTKLLQMKHPTKLQMKLMPQIAVPFYNL